jgi:hypothetical protein
MQNLAESARQLGYVLTGGIAVGQPDCRRVVEEIASGILLPKLASISRLQQELLKVQREKLLMQQELQRVYKFAHAALEKGRAQHSLFGENGTGSTELPNATDCLDSPARREVHRLPPLDVG